MYKKKINNTLSNRFALSDHFIMRWNERLPDDWYRFIWMLNHGYYYLMYTNKDGEEHYLHYNEIDNQWVMFITSSPKFGVRVLVTVYVVDENDISASKYFESAYKALKNNRENTLSLHFSIYSRKSDKVYSTIKTVKLDTDSFISIDDITVDSNLEYVAESLLNDDRFMNILEKSYPNNKQVTHCWLTILGKNIDLNVEPITNNS